MIFENYVHTTGSASYSVRIDREAPTCNVMYSMTGFTNQDVIATLVSCSETVTGAMSYTFT